MSTDNFSYPGLTSEQCSQFDRFADILIEQNKIHNLTRIIDLADVHKRHFADSLAALPMLKEVENEADAPLSLIDIGSGAGLPGLALAIAMPDWQITSVEATGKKVKFQQLVIDELGLTNATAIHGRAEILTNKTAYREKFNIATARALAEMSMLTELALPFVKIGGSFLAWKGPSVNEELNNAQHAIKTLGGQINDSTTYELSEEHKFAIANIIKTHKTPPQYPREYKSIKNSPLR